MSATRVKALATVSFGPGVVLHLAPAQVAPRAHLLGKVGNGRYSVTGEVQFKVGEEFGIEGDVPKSLLGILSADKPPEKAADKPKSARPDDASE